MTYIVRSAEETLWLRTSNTIVSHAIGGQALWELEEAILNVETNQTNWYARDMISRFKKIGIPQYVFSSKIEHDEIEKKLAELGYLNILKPVKLAEFEAFVPEKTVVFSQNSVSEGFYNVHAHSTKNNNCHAFRTCLTV